LTSTLEIAELPDISSRKRKLDNPTEEEPKRAKTEANRTPRKRIVPTLIKAYSPPVEVDESVPKLLEGTDVVDGGEEEVKAGTLKYKDTPWQSEMIRAIWSIITIPQKAGQLKRLVQGQIDECRSSLW